MWCRPRRRSASLLCKRGVSAPFRDLNLTGPRMIEFATPAEAERALSTLNGTLVNGASIRLQR